MTCKKIVIDGVEFVSKEEMAEKKNGLPYVICRTHSAGVFAGYLYNKNGKEFLIKDARRLWYWSGAASLSELAVNGTKKPEACKFPCCVDEIILTEVIEVLLVTEKAKKSIQSVPVWSA